MSLWENRISNQIHRPGLNCLTNMLWWADLIIVFFFISSHHNYRFFLYWAQNRSCSVTLVGSSRVHRSSRAWHPKGQCFTVVTGTWVMRAAPLLILSFDLLTLAWRWFKQLQVNHSLSAPVGKCSESNHVHADILIELIGILKPWFAMTVTLFQGKIFHESARWEDNFICTLETDRTTMLVHFWTPETQLRHSQAEVDPAKNVQTNSKMFFSHAKRKRTGKKWGYSSVKLG